MGVEARDLRCWNSLQQTSHIIGPLLYRFRRLHSAPTLHECSEHELWGTFRSQPQHLERQHTSYKQWFPWSLMLSACALHRPYQQPNSFFSPEHAESKSYFATVSFFDIHTPTKIVSSGPNLTFFMCQEETLSVKGRHTDIWRGLYEALYNFLEFPRMFAE